jgi:hypothetical protein
VVPPEELQVPALPEVDIGGSDDFQVSGFYDKEGGGAHTFRWTGGCASIYLPGAQPGAALRITASALRRPSAADVKATFAGVPVGGFRVGDDWSEYAVTLPDPLPAAAPILRLDVPAWRPANVLPGSDDMRDLGVMVDRIAVQPAGRPDVNIPVSPGDRPPS